MDKIVKFNSSQLEASLKDFKKAQIKEFTLQDQAILSSKGKLLRFLGLFEQYAPQTLLTLPVDASVLDMDVCKACSKLFCTLEIPLSGVSRNGAFLFDKKFYSKRANMLNTLGLIFGFDIDFAVTAGDSVRLFMERLDFALSLYPNHIDFPALESDGIKIQPKVSATYSAGDIQRSKEIAFACSTFYSAGRAVTWFLAVLAPLKLSPSKFFADFAEWQRTNNCSIKSGWNYNEASHQEIERMQLEFLKFKYEEKNKAQLFELVSNIVRLNGAMARCYGEGEESVVELNYNPDELLSYSAMNVQSFFENAFMENSHVKVFMGSDGVEYHYC